MALHSWQPAAPRLQITAIRKSRFSSVQAHAGSLCAHKKTTRLPCLTAAVLGRSRGHTYRSRAPSSASPQCAQGNRAAASPSYGCTVHLAPSPDAWLSDPHAGEPSLAAAAISVIPPCPFAVRLLCVQGRRTPNAVGVATRLTDREARCEAFPGSMRGGRGHAGARDWSQQRRAVECGTAEDGESWAGRTHARELRPQKGPGRLGAAPRPAHDRICDQLPRSAAGSAARSASDQTGRVEFRKGGVRPCASPACLISVAETAVPADARIRPW